LFRGKHRAGNVDFSVVFVFPAMMTDLAVSVSEKEIE
jgi:hypothetical protein